MEKKNVGGEGPLSYLHRCCLVAVATLLVVTLSYRPALAENGFFNGSNKSPALLTVGAGAVGVLADRDEAYLFNAEYRAGPSLEFFFIRPSLGLIVTTDKSFYGYFGLSGDIFFGKHIVLTPQAAVGGYSKGDGQDLGGTIEFKTGAVLAWRFDNEARVGVGLHHISNANIYDENPGTELLTFYYSHPINF
jgi:lipid A 3-O-deacylase